jgi:hypothetical protein
MIIHDHQRLHETIYHTPQSTHAPLLVRCRKECKFNRRVGAPLRPELLGFSRFEFPLVPTVNRHSAGTPAKSQISGHVLALLHSVTMWCLWSRLMRPLLLSLLAALYHWPKYWQTLEIRVSSGTKSHLSWFLQAPHHLLVDDTDAFDHVGLSCQCSPPYPP